MKKLLFNCVLILMAFGSYAQFEITGEIRPRFEFRNGYKELRTDSSNAASTFVTQRSRIGLNYKKGIYKTRISFQDVRIWGEEQMKKNQLNISLHEAWVDINITKKLSIKTGRQGIQYDNGRLMTKANWNQVGLKHDAIKLAYKAKGFEAELVGAYNQSSAKNFETPYNLYDKQYQSLGVLWMKKSYKNFSLASLYIVEGLQESDTTTSKNIRVTSGLIADANLSDFSIQARGFYQTGKTQEGRKVSAYFANADASYKLNGHFKFSAGMEYFSGNEKAPGEDETDHAFDILYGSRHKFNGLLDYFSTPSTTKGYGLVDPYAKVNTKVNNFLNIGVEYHYFMTPKAVKLDDQEFNNTLGQEIDLIAKIKISKEINLLAIYGFIMPTETLEIITGEPNALTGHYFMTMLTFKPVFFKNQK